MEKPPKESGINKIIGPGGHEEPLLKFLKGDFENQERLELKEFEIDKSPEEEKCIEDIQFYMDDFVRSYDGSPIKIPPKAVHFLNRSQVPAELKKNIFPDNIGGASIAAEQAMFVLKDREGDLPKLHLGETIVHEMLHFNSFNSLEINRSEKPGDVRQTEDNGDARHWTLKDRRSGIGIIGENNEHLFGLLDEALTEELTIRFFNQFFSKIDFLKDEFAEREKTIEKLCRDGKHDPEEERSNIAWKFTEEIDGRYKTTIGTFVYEDERHKLKDLINGIYEKNKDKFASKEEVFNLFARAKMQGNLLPLARFLEETYGKGEFRRLAEVSKKGKTKN